MIWSAVLTMTSLPSLMFRVASFGAWSNKTSGRTVFLGHGDTLLFPSIEERGTCFHMRWARVTGHAIDEVTSHAPSCR